MKQTVNFSMFCDAFSIRKENFSYDGLEALYNYLEESDEDYELDVIALCCEYSEYDDLAAFQEDYGKEYETIEDIENRTMVIPIDGTDGFIVQDF